MNVTKYQWDFSFVEMVLADLQNGAELLQVIDDIVADA